MLHLFSQGYFQSALVFNENVTPMRTVEHYEVELVAFGTGFSYINGLNYAHIRNRLILAKPGDRRFTIGAYECQFIKFDCDDAELTALLAQLPSTAILKTTLLDSLVSSFNAGDSPESAAGLLQRQSALFAILAEAAPGLRHETPENALSSPHLQAILAAKDYMDTRYPEKITLDTLALRAHLSKNYFRTQFCALMGVSPQAYLTQVRLARAKALLRGSPDALSEVAAACGFDSQSYMNYVFQRHLGVSPLQFRRQPQEG